MKKIDGLSSVILETIAFLPENDCDLKTLAIVLNPNYIHGSDDYLRNLVKVELDNMVLLGIVSVDQREIKAHDLNHKSKIFGGLV